MRTSVYAYTFGGEKFRFPSERTFEAVQQAMQDRDIDSLSVLKLTGERVIIPKRGLRIEEYIPKNETDEMIEFDLPLDKAIKMRKRYDEFFSQMGRPPASELAQQQLSKF